MRRVEDMFGYKRAFRFKPGRKVKEGEDERQVKESKTGGYQQVFWQVSTYSFAPFFILSWDKVALLT